MLKLLDLGLPPRENGRLAAQQSHSTTAINSAEARFGTGMGSATQGKHFAESLHKVGPSAAAPPATRDGALTLTLKRELLTRISNKSNLILDPDLDSFYTMSLSVLRFSDLLEVVDSMHRLTWQMAASPAAGRATMHSIAGSGEAH